MLMSAVTQPRITVKTNVKIPGHRQMDPGISQLPLQVTAAWVTPDPVTLSGGMPDHAGVRTGLRGQC